MSDLSFKKIAKKAESKLKAAQSQAGKTFKAAQQSQTANRLRAGQTRMVNKLSGRSDSFDETSSTGSPLQEEDQFQYQSPAKQQQAPSILKNDVEPDFTGDPESASKLKEQAEKELHSKSVVNFIRDDWIRSQMNNRENEYTDKLNMSAFIGTWNVNGKKPQESLDSWLDMGRDKPLPDLYVIGFQEMVDLNAANVVSETASRERSQAWRKMLQDTVNSIATRHAESTGKGNGRRYLHIADRYLVGILISIFVLDEHQDFVHDVQTTTVATGVMGVMGNKGGAVVRFRLYDSRFCFVCAHMAAHRENVEGRNADFHNIMQKIAFKNEAHAEAQSHVPAEYRNDRASNAQFGVMDHDFVFWLGDFNYRMDMRHSIEDVFARVEQYDFDWLNENDQLNIERKAGRVFQGFHEHSLNFLPTYKYQVGTQNYDRRPEKKIRAPAWCDRILFAAPTYDLDNKKAKFPIAMNVYDRGDLLASDHKPVFGFAGLVVKRVNKDRKRDTINDIVRMLDKWENECIPKVEITPEVVSFAGGVKYRVRSTASINIENSGQVPVAWRFVPKLDDLSLCRPWLSVSTEFGMLMPGETQTIQLGCFVTNQIARDVLAGLEYLDEILILRVENGRDHFVSVTAELLPTCFGQSLNVLVKHPYPLRISNEERQVLAQVRKKKVGDKAMGKPLPVPKEVWRLVNHLFLYGGCTEPHLFLRTGSQEEMNLVRDCLDTGAELPAPPQIGLHSVASTLVDLINSFPQSVVPVECYPNVDFDSVNIQTWSLRFLEQLPPLNYNMLVYVLLFLRELLQPANSSRNSIHPPKMAHLFGSILFRPQNAQAGGKKRSGDNISSWILGDSSSSSDPPEVRLIYFLLSSNALNVGRSA